MKGSIGLAVAAACAAQAGPKGEIKVRPLGDAKITIDGNFADWPLNKFNKVAEQPLFPAGQEAESTSAAGDYVVFDTKRIGRFNGTGEDAFQASDSDFGVSTYFAYDHRFLYILSVCIDDTLRDDKDTTQFGTQGFLNDGFEFFLDTKGDSTDCISDDGFPNVDQVEPNSDDMQVTVAINSTFKPKGAAADVLGARQTIERAGNPDLIGPEKGGPGGLWRDQLDAIGGPDIAAMKFADLRAAGARNPEILAKPAVKFTGYAIEMRIPLRGKIPNLVANHKMGFEIFWRDVDADDDAGKGGGNISWASWAQSTDVPCTDPKKSLFNTANWGSLVFDTTDPLVPIPAGKPNMLFVSSDGSTTPNADADLIDLFQSKGYGVTLFTANGSTPEGLREAAKGKSVVFISETIGSTSVLDPAGAATGVFSLKDTDVPVVSFEAYMYDNADWVSRTETGSNDFINWGNSGRTEVPEAIQDARDSMYIKGTHPITAGFTGKVPVFKEPYSFNFGLPSPDADVLATIQPDGTFPTLFVYEKGDKLVDGSVAPNKRIGLFLGQGANPNANTPIAFTNLTDAGITLLVNTINYASGAGASSGDTASGLLAYWRLNETDGTVVVDSSGKGRNGKIINNAAGTWVTDAERGAVYKSTGVAVIDFGILIPAMTTANDFTWSLWLKSDETGTAGAANNNIVFGNRYSATGADFSPREFIKFTPSNFEWHFNAAGQNVDYPDFVVGKWTHHAVVKKGNALTYYRDGAETKVGTITGGPKNPQPLYLGGQGTQERWKGAADEIAIFDRALTPADVKKAFDLGKANQPLVPAPLGISSAKIEGTNLVLTWSSGTGPFQVQRRDDVATGSWANVGAPTDARTATVPLTGSAGFFRISGK